MTRAREPRTAPGFLEALACPWLCGVGGLPSFCGVGELDPSCHGGGLAGLELDRAEHAQGAVATLAVMEDLEVFEDGVGELDAGPPAVSVEQLDLHPGPDRNVASPPAKATAIPREDQDWARRFGITD